MPKGKIPHDFNAAYNTKEINRKNDTWKSTYSFGVLDSSRIDWRMLRTLKYPRQTRLKRDGKKALVYAIETNTKRKTRIIQSSDN